MTRFLKQKWRRRPKNRRGRRITPCRNLDFQPSLCLSALCRFLLLPACFCVCFYVFFAVSYFSQPFNCLLFLFFLFCFVTSYLYPIVALGGAEVNIYFFRRTVVAAPTVFPRRDNFRNNPANAPRGNFANASLTPPQLKNCPRAPKK